MATHSIFPFTDGSDGSGRGLSSALWDQVNFEAAKGNPLYGSVWEEDFIALADDQVTVTALNSATGEGFAKIASAHGVRSLVATTAADHRGAQVLMPAIGSYEFADGGLVVVEFTVDLNKCSTFFVGLVEDGLTIFDGSSDLPTNASYAGFYRKDGGVVNFATRDDDGGGDTTDTQQILAADYYHKLTAGESEPTRLGFLVHGGSRCLVVVDGVAYRDSSEDINIDSFPASEVLTPALAAARGAGQDETAVRLDIDYFKGFCRT